MNAEMQFFLYFYGFWILVALPFAIKELREWWKIQGDIDEMNKRWKGKL